LRTRKNYRSWLVLLVLVAGSGTLHGQTVDINNPPQGRFFDEWFELHMGGAKIGYAHNTTARIGERIETSTDFHIKIGRADSPVVMDTTQKTTETIAGGPLSFESDMRFSQMKSAMRGTIKDGKITVVTSQYGMDQTQEFAFPKDALLSWGLFREQVTRGFEPGTKYSLKTYSPELRLDDAISAQVAVGDWEEFTVGGKKTRGQKLTVTMEGPTGALDMVSWVNKEGLPLKSRVAMPGLGDMEMFSVSQVEAVKDFVPPEMFMTTVLKANRKIDKDAAESIRYRIKSKQPGAKLDDLPETDSQKVKRIDAETLEVTVSRLPHGNAETRKRGNAETPKNSPTSIERTSALAEYLEPNLMMNNADAKLMELARTAAGGEKEPYALGDKLRRFVTDYVTTKSLNVGFATASEVARTREGDCSEHGVLLAALGRLNGLPSRVAVGLAYVPIFGGQDDIFGYHLWTQFYIDGRWTDFDAALRESECSPIRITFAVSSLQNSGVADLSLPLISKIGAIDLEIIEVKNR
jgi:transglutaminase-like putative cysteine protease